MAFYLVNLAVLVLANGLLLFQQYVANKRDEFQETQTQDPEIKPGDGKEAIRRFEKDFFTVYLLAVAADWLQVRTFNPMAGVEVDDRKGYSLTAASQR